MAEHEEKVAANAPCPHYHIELNCFMMTFCAFQPANMACPSNSFRRIVEKSMGKIRNVSWGMVLDEHTAAESFLQLPNEFTPPIG